jgi:release factor glutamine methyltransferase
VTGGSSPHPSGSRDDPGPVTRAQALFETRRAFERAGLDHPALDARILLMGALGIGPFELATRPETGLTAREAETIASYRERRLSREPVARILGEREFWGLPFILSPETLVPRPDTETVVETALDLVPDRSARMRILDLGTGSGCLLVALLHECPGAFGLGIDRSPEALRTARQNALRNGVGDRAVFAACDWAACLDRRFDLIVSNPPYIPSGDIAALDPDVRDYDPTLALDGGPDGLDAYRTILAEAGRLLAPEGLLVLEIGYDQADALPQLSAALGLDVVRLAHDLSGNARCIALKGS